MSRAAERYRQNVARKNHDAITARDDNTNALEVFALEEGLSLGGADSAQPETNPLSAFAPEETTPPQPRPRPLELKRYAALAAGIAAAVAIGPTIIVFDRPPAGIAVATTPSLPTQTRATAFTANRAQLIPALPAVSPAPPRVFSIDGSHAPEPSSDSPSAAQSDAMEPERATPPSRRKTIGAAKLILPSGVLPRPAVVAADAPAALPPLIAATPVVPAEIAPLPPARAAVPLAPAESLADTDVIQAVLGRYQGAFRTLDSVAASAVWPTVDRKALSRAFERLEEQRIEFDKCQIAVEGPRAVASCDGRTRYVPRVGNRSPRTEARQWRFTLHRLEEEWLIDQVESR